MNDPTEAIRRERLAEINAEPGPREALEAQYGQVWDTAQLGEQFEVIGFMAPLVVVRRKSDGQKGSLVSPATIPALNSSCMLSEPLPHPLVGPRPLERMGVAMIVFRPGGQDVGLELLLALPRGAFQIIMFERMYEDLCLV
jgi:hypothetical protein